MINLKVINSTEMKRCNILIAKRRFHKHLTGSECHTNPRMTDKSILPKSMLAEQKIPPLNE